MFTPNFRYKEGPAFYLLVAAGGLVAALGVAAAYYMEHMGHIVTNMTNQIPWALPHVFAIFLIISASGVMMVASIGTLFGKNVYKPRARLACLLAIALLALSGCAGSQSGSAYSRSQTRGEMHVRMGVIESVRTVMIEGTQSGVGAVAGGVVGGIAGSNVGQGKGSTVGSVLGAVLGGVAGQAIEEKTTKKEGLEITVKLDSGQIIAVTQEADEQFRAGEKVRVLSGSGVTRVSH